MDKLGSVLYKGQEHKVKTISYPGKTSQIIYRADEFIVYINNKVKESRLTQETAQQLKLWLIEKAEVYIKERTAKISANMGISYNNIRIKDTKTRWGSCSSKKNLNFNFRLIMVPEQVMDYVIIHELCHLKHMNHSKEFWLTVESHMPEYSKYKEWLKINGMQLYKV